MSSYDSCGSHDRRSAIRGARLSAASPRRLGDALLRALRNARTEEEAAAGLWVLLGAVEPSSSGAES